MKKLLFFITFITMVINVNSQTDDFCATPENYTPDPEGVFSYSTDPSIYEEGDPLVLNIYYWQVKGPNGEYEGVFNETKVLESVAFLNIVYNPFNIFFKYRGYDSFNTPNAIDIRYEDNDNDGNYECTTYPDPDPLGYGSLDRCQIGYFFQYAYNEGYKEPNAINIYVPYETLYFGGAASGIGSDKNVVPVDNLNKTSFLHEIGHNLGLKHTTQGWRSSYNPDNENSCHGCERVTRTIGDPNYNAHCKGDKITDTNAVPNFKREDYYNLIDAGATPAEAEANYIPYRWVDQETCLYTGDGTDCEGTDYTIFHEDVINVMLPALPCDDYYFSPGQGNYMREKIDYIGVLSDALTDVSELYEPYSGEYYIAGPLPSEHPPLFQPGFEYRFVECVGDFDEPADYGTLFPYSVTVLLSIPRDVTDYHSITHPNHSAILIKHEYGDFLNKPEKCYNNFNRKPSGGSITKFNDDVFNTNVTITPQDSTAINNQNLIENLEGGLYKIDKNYEDGSTQETVIYKENN